MAVDAEEVTALATETLHEWIEGWTPPDQYGIQARVDVINSVPESGTVDVKFSSGECYRVTVTAKDFRDLR